MKQENERPQPVLELIDAYEALTQPRVNLVEVYHDALQAREEAMSLFNLGYMSLPMRAATERLFWGIGRKILHIASAKGELPDDLQDLPQILSDIYYVNMSIFQTLPDHWAIDQLFPICPIPPAERGAHAPGRARGHHLRLRRPDRQVHRQAHRLQDHPRAARAPPGRQRPREPYYLGVFLLGAYQEVLGDLHNLYGDNHVVHVSFDDSPGVGDWDLDEVVEGDCVKEVLSYVQYEWTTS